MGDFPADASTITAAATAMDHTLSTIRTKNLDNGVLTAARAEVQRAIDAGHGTEGYGRLAAL